MRRLVWGWLLLLPMALLQAQEDPKKKDPAKSLTPSQMLQAIQKEYAEDVGKIEKALEAAKSPEEQRKLFKQIQERSSLYLPRYLAIVEKFPKDPVVVEALTAALGLGPNTDQEQLKKVFSIILSDHTSNEKLTPVVQQLGYNLDPETAEFLRKIAEKSPHASVQLEALLGYAQNCQQVVMLKKQLKDNPDMVEEIRTQFGKKLFDYIETANTEKLEKESGRAYQKVIDQHLAKLDITRVSELCMRMGYDGSKTNEDFLRKVIAKDTRNDVKGYATFSLAQVLKSQANAPGASGSDKLLAEAEKMFEQVAEKYKELKLPFGGTISNKAQSELFDIRHLSVGKPAPEVEGIDQDGKKFKLSDYKGKVVFLDFWNEF